jgi:hypothetical protein
MMHLPACCNLCQQGIVGPQAANCSASQACNRNYVPAPVLPLASYLSEGHSSSVLHVLSDTVLYEVARAPHPALIDAMIRVY